MKKLSVYLIFIQTFVIVLLAVNCLLLKTETGKQIEISKEQLDLTSRAQKAAQEAKIEAVKLKRIAQELQDENLKCKDRYEEALKQKK